jgi:hypothetical protein
MTDKIELTQSQLSEMQTIIKVATSVDVDTMTFANGTAKGFSESKDALLFTTTGIAPDFPSMTVTRAKSLKERYELVAKQSAYKVSGELKGEALRILKFSSKLIKTECRLGSPTSITKVPEVLADSFVLDVTITNDEFTQISKAASVVDIDITTITVENGNVTVKFVDQQHDEIEFAISTPATVIDGADVNLDDFKVSANYNTKHFLTLIRAVSDDKVFSIGKRGLGQFVVNNVTMVLPPVKTKV